MKHSKVTFKQESKRCLFADHILNLKISSAAFAIFRYGLGISDREKKRTVARNIVLGQRQEEQSDSRPTQIRQQISRDELAAIQLPLLVPLYALIEISPYNRLEPFS
jgi:hypothetical protein